jgi:hypothetical protein
MYIKRLTTLIECMLLKQIKEQRAMKHLKILFVFLLSFAIASGIQAEDGMWMPHQMKDLNLKALGLKMDPEDLYKKDGTGLMSAVVNLGGGTGEFVSAEGLILTNHHVAFGAIQRASTEEKDYIQNGFMAWKKGEEIPARGYIADVLLGYDEVTDKVQAVLKPDMTHRQKYDVLEKVGKKLIADAEKEGPDIRASVATMYSGNKYYLFRFKRIKDIRLVYAPPRDLGNFGGDIDNWMWPRHTCDFSFLRAYVSKGNVGVDHNAENVPYKPKSVMKISLAGFKEGDLSFVMGYPGRTYRNYTLSELQSDVKFMKKRIELYEDIIAFIEQAWQDKRDIQIKYASIHSGLNNSLKNYQGKLEGMEKISLVERKKNLEKKFLEWAKQTPERQEKYSNALSAMEAYMDRFEKHNAKSSLLGQMTSSYFGSALLSQAYTIYRTVMERQKPDIEREPSYQDRNISYIKMRIELAERGYDLATDRAFFKHQLKKLLDLSEDQLPEAFRVLIAKKTEKSIEEYIDRLYDNTIMADAKKRLELVEMKPDQLMKLNDPFINLASKLETEMKSLREKSQELGQERQDIKKAYLEALLDQQEGLLAPDANSTIRFTYGFIKGYYPRDAVYYKPQTSLKGVVEKDTGEFPFNVPDKLKTLYQEKDFGRYTDSNLNDIPACFLNTTSVTGGNSGSPTLNAKGEQTGIIFDMTYESVTSDYYIVPELQRTISVDIRFVLFVTEKFSGAAHIIKEMGF